MMKIYNSSLIKSIQDVINSTRFKMTTFHEYDFMDTLNTAEILIKYTVDASTGKRSCILVINNSDISSKFVAEWYQTAGAKFSPKDYKKDRRDFIGNTLYHELKFELNGEKIKVLVRLLDEITDPNISNSEKNDYIKNYGDITIDNKYFSVIKITKDDGIYNWGSYDIYKSRDTFIDSEMFESSSYIEEAEENNDNDIEDITDDSLSSDPLF